MDYDELESLKKAAGDFGKNSGKFFGLLILLVVGFLIVSQGWYTVNEQENAVVTTAGKVTYVATAGLHFKVPIIQQVTRVNMTRQGMTLGYIENGTSIKSTGDNIMISNDFNIVSIDFYIEWNVTDPAKFLYNSQDPVALLSNIVQSNARDTVSAYKIDSVLTDGKSEIQSKIQELVNETLAEYDLGLTMANITIQDAEPPTDEVVAAFKAVEDAKQKKDTLINEANRYYNENIPNARAEADKIVRQAEAVKQSRINEATGQTARFNQMFEEYINNPDITKTRMYLETVEEVMPGVKMIIDGANSGDMLKILDLNN